MDRDGPANDSSGEEEVKRDSDGDDSDNTSSSDDVREVAAQQSSPNLHLYMWYFEQCDPKKCSGMQLKRFGKL